MHSAGKTLLALTLCFFSLFFSCRSAWAIQEPTLYAEAAILIDAATGQVLYEKNSRRQMPPASLTKILTCLLAMEEGNAGDLVAIPQEATQLMPGSAAIGLVPGEVHTMGDLLYAMMLPSANEAANVLAVAVDGSIEAFVEHMNRRAAELGCKGTHYANTHGMHQDEHYTTAYDLALTMQACLEHDLFRTITTAPKHTVPATGVSGEREFYNTNGLVSSWKYSGYLYDKCVGGKTGSTDEAGRCLVSAAEDGDELLISVILGSGPMNEAGYEQLRQGQFVESRRLLEYGFSNFQRVTITKGDEPVDKVKVTMSRQADEVNLKPQGSITRTLPKSMDVDDIEYRITRFADEVEAPVEAGQVMGTMTLYYEDEVYGTLDLVAVTSVERSDLLHKKQQFFDFFQSAGVKLALACGGLVVLLAGLQLLVFRKRRRPHAKAGARTSRRGNYRGNRRY